MKQKETIVEVSDVSFAYGKTPVLIEASFSVHQGEFIGIIGPNGGGKTTLLRLLLGFLTPSSGTIRIVNPREIAYVPQSARFDKSFPISVEEVILSGLLSKLPWYGHFAKKERDLAREALEKVKLSHLIDAPFGSLSGGEAQRVLIARAIVSDPKLLLLDEPTSGVDVKAEADILTILKEIQANRTILMVTHDLQTAVEQVDRVICVQRQVSIFEIKDICEHFALGLYHFPLQNNKTHHSLPAHFR